MTTGQRIKFFRKEHGYTQSELAEMIGVSMQAVSKWETDAGMPDISQIVPLARALQISSDQLLGLDDDGCSEELSALRAAIGHHGIAFSVKEAGRVYALAVPFFAKHPTNSEVAFWCLESFSVLLSERLHTEDKANLLKECSRYELCIFRYETNADVIFKSYYVLSRCYHLLGEERRAEEMMERIPTTFGDRAYWEAEFAYAEGNMELAIQKCKLSFHDKARYISRCIRMARQISVAVEGSAGLKTQLALNEYMRSMINAFLLGGEYLPHRMVYQKMALLSGMVRQYAELGRMDTARERMRELLELREQYLAFLHAPQSKHCLMFPEGDDDGIWHVTPDRIEAYVAQAERALTEAGA